MVYPLYQHQPDYYLHLSKCLALSRNLSIWNCNGQHSAWLNRTIGIVPGVDLEDNTRRFVRILSILFLGNSSIVTWLAGGVKVHVINRHNEILISLTPPL